MRSHTKLLVRTEHFQAGVFRSLSGAPGELRCAVARSHLIAIPRSVVALTREGSAEQIATPVRAVFYNQGCRYTARSVCSLRETTLFIRVPTAILAEAIRPHDPRVDARGERPLTFSDGPMSDATYLALTELVMRPASTDHADEVLRRATRELVAGAYAEREKRAPARHGVNDADYVRRAQELISLCIGERVGFDEIARRAGVSLSHLNLAFKRRLGMTPGEFRTCLRVRSALDSVVSDPGAFAPLAAGLGYSEPEQFAIEFRSRFGMRPEMVGSILRSGVLHMAGQ